MNILQIIIIINSLIFGGILFKSRKKISLILFLGILLGILSICFFAFYSSVLDTIGRFFGIDRGVLLLVYLCIILYGYIFLRIEKANKQRDEKFSNYIMKESLKNIKTQINEFKNYGGEYEKIMIIIPSYNEEKKILEVLDELKDIGIKNIVICNDGSNDNTEEKILLYKENNKNINIFLINHGINLGYGGASRTLLEFSKRYGKRLGIDSIISIDADGQMDPKSIKKFKSINNGKNILLGTRFHKDSTLSGGITILRRIILFGAKIITYLFEGLRIDDPHNGYRLIPINLLKKMELKCDSMTFASEIIMEIKEKNIPYKEIPVSIRYTEYSIQKGQKNSNAIKIVLEIFYKKFFN